MTRLTIPTRAALGVALALSLAAPLAAQDTSRVTVAPGSVLALSLGDATRLAGRQNASSEAARLRVSQAEARVRQRRADLLPNLSADAVESGHTINSATFGFDFPSPPGEPPILDPRGQIIGPVNTIDVRGHLSVPIYDAGARGRVSAARAGVSASGAEAASVAERAATNGAVAYVRALRADAQLLARIADSTLAFDLLVIARDQLTAGVGVALDVTRAQSQVATGRAQLIVARNERDRARLDLVRALGLPTDTRITLTDSLTGGGAPPSIAEREALARALGDRPDVRAATEQIHAIDRQIDATRAERLPTVAAFGDEGVIAKNSNGNYLNTYQWGIQLSVPIFEGFRRDGRLEEAELQRREADVRLRDLREQASVDVRQALLDIASTREQVDAAREHLRLAELELAQARDRFRAGVAGNADVITASLSLNAARTQVNDALTGYQLARIGLARAQGSIAELR